MRKIVWTILIMLPLCVKAQSGGILHGNCTPDIANAQTTRGGQRHLPTPNASWDPERIYRQAVVLFSFADKDFSMENPREFYDSIFNMSGYNKGVGPGCVADYFREQSGGLLNLQFDVYGPYKITRNAKSGSSPNYGYEDIKEATKLWLAEDTLRQYRDYDWNDDKYLDQVIYINAGYAGNQSSDVCKGCIWPNTSSMSNHQTPDGFMVQHYSCSAELTTSNRSWGIGTICHEFSHSLGLPDIYPTATGAGYSMVDEWDLMDGGNFTNGGWCPPNYSGLERWLMGWQTPEELTEPASIRNMKPLSEGGPVYMVSHTDDEYYLLENRQWTRWDARLPGRGLVVFHVVYNASKWRSNMVNNTKTQRGYQLVHADSLDYDAWDAIIGGKNPYVSGHNRYLSTSAYPWTTDSTDFVNDQLTDTSTPPSLMYDNNEAGSKYLSKAITNIRVSDDGLVSFDFMGGDLARVSPIEEWHDKGDAPWYSLQGHRLSSEPLRKGLYIRNGRLVSKH